MNAENELSELRISNRTALTAPGLQRRSSSSSNKRGQAGKGCLDFIVKRVERKKVRWRNCKFDRRSGLSVIQISPGGTSTIRHILCGRLDCLYCGVRIRHEFLQHVKQAAREHKIRFMYTLTVPGKYISRAEQKARLKSARKALMTNLAAVRKQGLVYLWAIGSGNDNGRMHIHLFTNIDIWRRRKHGSTQVWLPRMWRKWTNGGNARRSAEYYAPEATARYFVKAIFETVEWGRIDSNPLYGCSRGIQLRDRFTPEDDGSTWKLYDTPSATLAEHYGIVKDYPVNAAFQIPDDCVNDLSPRIQTDDVIPAGVTATRRTPGTLRHDGRQAGEAPADAGACRGANAKQEGE